MRWGENGPDGMSYMLVHGSDFYYWMTARMIQHCTKIYFAHSDTQRLYGKAAQKLRRLAWPGLGSSPTDLCSKYPGLSFVSFG